MNKNIKILSALLIILVVYCSAIYFAKDIAIWLYDIAPSNEDGKVDDILTKTGQFGDSAGAINALFSALAFFGVLWALITQKEDSKKQEENIRIERFENTFFQMLSLQQEMVKDLYFPIKKEIENNTLTGDNPNSTITIEPSSIVGRELFRYIYEENTYSYSGISYKGMKDVLNKFGQEYYEPMYTTPYFDHYFRHLYRIIKLIDETDLLPNDFETKYKYTSIVRGQLSRYELIWIFYNCLSDNGNKKFKPLLETYSLLKNIRIELLAKQSDKDLYNSKCKNDFIEKPDTDFSKEYKRSAFIKETPVIKKYKCTLPKILDININIKYSHNKTEAD